MARGLTLSAGLTAFIARVLAHETCNATAKVNHHCAPSSCGDIPNISFPFRSKNDPEKCGDSRSELSCENNHTVLYLFEGIYYLEEINYNNFTVRVVDSAIQKDNYFSAPCYSLNRHNFSQHRPAYTTYLPKWTEYWDPIPELSRSVVLMSCEKQVNSRFYLDASTCTDHGEYSCNSSISHSKRYRYFKVGRTNASEVEGSCQVEKMFRTLWPRNDDPNISCTDVYNDLVYGFEISWLQGICQILCGRQIDCHLDGTNRVHCVLYKCK